MGISGSTSFLTSETFRLPMSGRTNGTLTPSGESRMAKNKGRKQSDGTVREATPAKNGTIRSETAIFRAIVNFAADKQYIRERQVPKGKLLQDKAGRGVHAAGIRRPSYLRARMDLRIRDEVLSLVADDGLQLHARHGQYGNAAAGSENPSLARLRQAAAHAGKS